MMRSVALSPHPESQISAGVVIFLILTKKCILVDRLSDYIVWAQAGSGLPATQTKGPRYEQIEWKDCCNYRRRHWHRPRRGKALHRRGRFRLHLWPQAGRT